MKINRRQLPLNALRVFDAMVRHKNIKQAADELGVTHSAVSVQISNLEKLLEVELFDRSFKPMRLNSKGEILYGSVSHSLDILSKATNEVSTGEIAGDLSVSCVPGLGANWLTHILGEFLETYDKIGIKLFTQSWKDQGTIKDVDLAITYGSATHAGKVVNLLGHAEFFPVCSPKLMTSTNLNSSPDEILSQRLLHDSSEETWIRWFANAGVDNPYLGRGITFDSAQMSLQAARAGIGIAMADNATVQFDLQEGRLVRISSLAIPAVHPYFIVTPAIAGRNPAIPALEAWLLQRYSEFTL